MLAPHYAHAWSDASSDFGDSDADVDNLGVTVAATWYLQPRPNTVKLDELQLEHFFGHRQEPTTVVVQGDEAETDLLTSATTAGERLLTKAEGMNPWMVLVVLLFVAGLSYMGLKLKHRTKDPQ